MTKQIEVDDDECRYIVNCCIEDSRGDELVDGRLTILAYKCGYRLTKGSAERLDGVKDKHYANLFGRSVHLD